MTSYENFQQAAKRNPDRPYLGRRPVKNGIVQDFEWLTYSQCAARSNDIGSGMRKLQLAPPKQDEMLNDRGCFGLFSKNLVEWVLVEQACYAHTIIPVPMYDTLDVDTFAYVVNQVELTSVLTTQDLIHTVISAKEKTPTLKYIVQIEDSVDPQQNEKASQAGLKIITISQLEKLGKENPAPHNPPAPLDVATFCYTSGTTGDPKGAVITHRNMISDVSAIIPVLGYFFPEDVHLSYLPLPHMFERMVQMAVTNAGGCIGFYQGDTLKLVEDLQCLRPTVFPSVPRLLNRIHDKLVAGAKEAGGLKAKLFEKALAAKLEGLKNGKLTHPLWDRLVFSAVKKKVGLDRIRLIVTGSAPIGDSVLNFLRAAFGCPVVEGYGQTESTVAISSTGLGDLTAGTVGTALNVNDIRLQDVPDMNYLSTDTNHGKAKFPCLGRGEICIRGPNILKGYYKMPDKMAETVDKEGWLHTGDIGLFLPDGRLKIIDRKKSLIKLAQGEYIAIEKIENVIIQSPYILQAFVHGDSLKVCLVAAVVVDPDQLAGWASKNGKNGQSPEEAVKDPEYYEEVMRSINKLCKDNHFLGYEYVKRVCLDTVQWTPADLLTPTFKLKRPMALEKYEKRFEEMYAAIDAEPKKAKL